MAVNGVERSPARDGSRWVDAQNRSPDAKSSEPKPKPTRTARYGHTGESAFDPKARPDASRLSGVAATPPKTGTPEVSLDGKPEDVAKALQAQKVGTSDTGVEAAFDDPSKRLVAVGANPELMGKGQDYSSELTGALDRMKARGEKLPAVALELVPQSSKDTIRDWGKAKDEYEQAKASGAPAAELEQKRAAAEELKAKLTEQIRTFMGDFPGITTPEKMVDLIDKVQARGAEVLPMEPGDKLGRTNPEDPKTAGLTQKADDAFARTVGEYLDQTKDSGGRVLMWMGQGHTLRLSPEEQKTYGMSSATDQLERYNPSVVGFAGGTTLPSVEKAASEYQEVLRRQGSDEKVDPYSDPTAKLSKAALLAGAGGAHFTVRVPPSVGPMRYADLYIHVPQPAQ